MSQTSAARHLPYTWDDYRSWPDDQRWELIDGEAYAMSPGPSVRHQRIQLDLGAQLLDHFRDRPCEPFVSPIDVKLSETDVVQPDLAVVCEPEKIRPSHIDGAPTLVIEILSPSSGPRDRGPKMDLYARAGVREVCLVTPFPPCLEVFVLDGAAYRRHAVLVQAEPLASPAFPDLRLDLAPLFARPPEPGDEVPEVKEPPGRYRSATAPA